MGAVVPYSQALFRAVWVESVWPLDEDVCRRAAATVGLSSSEFGEVLIEPATDGELRSTGGSSPTGAFGVPTLFVGDRMFWGNDRLVLVRHPSHDKDRGVIVGRRSWLPLRRRQGMSH